MRVFNLLLTCSFIGITLTGCNEENSSDTVLNNYNCLTYQTFDDDEKVNVKMHKNAKLNMY